MLKLTTPWGPSVNHYWGQNGKRRYVTKEGLAFRQHVRIAFLQSRHKGFGKARLCVEVTLCRKDLRRSDLDNQGKALFDSLVHAGVCDDDCQFDRIVLERGELCKPHGKYEVTITEMNHA